MVRREVIQCLNRHDVIITLALQLTRTATLFPSAIVLLCLQSLINGTACAWYNILLSIVVRDDEVVRIVVCLGGAGRCGAHFLN